MQFMPGSLPKETLIYSNQHQSLRLNMLEFQDFLALPLTGESFNQCFQKQKTGSEEPEGTEFRKAQFQGE